MGKRRHLEPKDICYKAKMIAREKRISDRATWSTMNIICGYTLLISEGFKGQRISNVCNKIAEYQTQIEEGTLTVKDLQDQIMERTGWTVDYRPYTLADIKDKKNTFGYWDKSIQIEAQNEINEWAMRYMLYMFKALWELHGYGEKRLTRVEQAMNNVVESYRYDNEVINKWKQALWDEGVYMEPPKDPTDESVGSLLYC